MSEAPPSCPVCGHHSAVRVAEHNGLPIVRCGECGQRFVSPMPTAAELASIYDQVYYQGGRGSVGFSDYAGLTAARERMFIHHLERLRPSKPAGTVLDVGCATGDFLKLARGRGWHAIGVDPSPAREQAIAAGLRVVGRTLDDADVASQSVDLVTFWDVLEHLPNPIATLRLAVRLLTSDGVVAATVPNAGSMVARFSGRRWFGYKTAGEHLQFFTASTIARCFRAAGLEVVRHEPVAWSCTIGFALDRAALYLGPAGRLANTILGPNPLARVIIDVPQVNQFIVGRRAAAPHSLAA